MLGRSLPLRTGLRRPTALRFDSPFSTCGDRLSPFGDGTYSGNIMQNGVVLQPQHYLLDGFIPMPRCIVITGAATVAADETTGAAAFMCRNLVLVGAAATLSSSANCKGLFGFVRDRVAARNGAHLHMDKLGKAGNFGNVSPDMLLPAWYSRYLATDKLRAYVVKGRGAEGGAPTQSVSNQYATYGHGGNPAGPMQTGGGGSGCPTSCWTGAGGCGGPCCGGAGSGGGVYNNTPGAGDFGGPGGPAVTGGGAGAGGGAGDPVGAGSGCGPGEGAGGGLLGLFSPIIDIGNATIVSADGASGGRQPDAHGVRRSGGAAGGGCIIFVTSAGGYRSHGTVRAAGGISSSFGAGGDGGAGSVNIFELTE